MNAPTAPFISTLREFVEKSLGFASPIENTSLAVLMDAGKQPLHYALRNIGKASLNAVSSVQWDKIHVNEQNPVFHELTESPLERAYAFIKKELAKSGYQPADTIRASHGATFNSLMNSFHSFMRVFEDNNPRVKFSSSMTLRRVEDYQNWDMVLRFLVENKKLDVMNEEETETLYVEYTFPSILTGLKFSITEDQVEYLAELMEHYFETMKEVAGPFYTLDKPLRFSDYAVHQILHNRAVTAEQILTEYSKLVKNNQHLVHGDAETINVWLSDTPWELLTKSQKMVLGTSVFTTGAIMDSYFNVCIAAASVAE